jgi:predicted dehydrogenase
VDDGDLYGTNREDVYFDVCDQYTIQGEKFSDAIIFDKDVPVSLENALGNTAIIEAIFESEKTGNWIDI